MNLTDVLTKSQGIKRTLASICAFAAMIAGQVPALAPYQAALTTIAGILGGVGVAHAVVS